MEGSAQNVFKEVCDFAQKGELALNGLASLVSELEKSTKPEDVEAFYEIEKAKKAFEQIDMNNVSAKLAEAMNSLKNISLGA